MHFIFIMRKNNKLHTSKNPSKERADDAHEQDANWEKSCHFMSAECC